MEQEKSMQGAPEALREEDLPAELRRWVRRGLVLELHSRGLLTAGQRDRLLEELL